MKERPVTVSATKASKLENRITCASHTLVADEPPEAGGTDHGPMPFELLASALGACTSMTLRLYADRKGYPLESTDVSLVQTVEGTERTIERVITLGGPLDADARQKLLDIANKCPVHRALEGSKVKVTTRLAE